MNTRRNKKTQAHTSLRFNLYGLLRSFRARNDVLRLANNLAVVCSHFEELSDGHLTLVAFLSLVDGDNAFGLFLLDSYGVPTAAARQCPRKRGRCSRLGRLSPTKKNVGSKEAYVYKSYLTID